MRYTLGLSLLFFLLLSLPVFSQDEPPAEENHNLTVWLPATLITPDMSDQLDLLNDYTEQFTEDSGITVTYRIKSVGDVGGLMSSLRSASAVAPDAMPDMTLIRRSDILIAQSLGIIQSLENMFSSTVISDLGSALRLGQIPSEEGNIILYGLPYFLQFQHVVYRPQNKLDYSTWTFDDVLSRGETFIFPANRPNGLNQTFYLQYLAAGGVPPHAGEMTLNSNALRTVLGFYEEAEQTGIVEPEVLSYLSPSAYRLEFMNSMVGLENAVFTSSEYFSMLETDSSIEAAPIPTANGTPTTALNGWMWVVVTPESDAAQQDRAIHYLNWMMDTEFQADFARMLYMIPSQRSAITMSLPDDVDETFINDLLENAILPLPDAEGGLLLRSMQDALIAVINGDLSAEEATQQVIELTGAG